MENRTMRRKGRSCHFGEAKCQMCASQEDCGRLDWDFSFWNAVPGNVHRGPYTSQDPAFDNAVRAVEEN